MDLCLQKESKWKNTDKESVGLCNRDKRSVCAKKGEGILTIEERERRNAQVHWRTTEERVYQTLKVISNAICVFCRKEEWKEIYDTGLLVFKWMNCKK